MNKKNNIANDQTTHNAKRGGIFNGPSHSKGGVKFKVVDTGQIAEAEGGEIIINKAASALHCEELSKINQSAGNGVAIPCNKQEVKEAYQQGGQLELFNIGGQLDDETLNALKITLKYASEIDQISIQNQIDIYSNKLLSAKEVNDRIEVEHKKLKALKSVNSILGLENVETDDQRKDLLGWIKNPVNDVKVLIAFSGGKDSVAMVLKALFIDKIPKSQIELHHHKVDGESDSNIWDWPCTDSYCKEFAAYFGIPIFFSFSGGGITAEIFRNGTPRFPMYFQEKENGPFKERPSNPNKTKEVLAFPAIGNDLGTRWCSSVAKIEVMSAILNNSIHFITDANIVVMTGERRLESQNRSKYNEIEVMKNTALTKNRKCIVWRSVIDYTEADVWELYKTHKVQPHPCYELGWSRCSCQLCIFNDADTWATANDLSPDRVSKIAKIETDLKALGSELPTLYNEFERIPFDPPQFIKSGVNKGKERLTKGKKLDNLFDAKVNKGKSFVTPAQKERWAKEANGEFTSPIIVTGEWIKPVGANSIRDCGAN
tara:strand:- start:10578 stop:12209 length:1632 start_codon:yes stop_codon:yes gene_type:complete